MHRQHDLKALIDELDQLGRKFHQGELTFEESLAIVARAGDVYKDIKAQLSQTDLRVVQRVVSPKQDAYAFEPFPWKDV